MAAEVETRRSKLFANCADCTYSRDLTDYVEPVRAVMSHAERMKHTVVLVEITATTVTPQRAQPEDTTGDSERYRER